MSKTHRMLAAGNMPRGSAVPGSREELLYALECYLAGQCTPKAASLLERTRALLRGFAGFEWSTDLLVASSDPDHEWQAIERARNLLREMGGEK